ncbi:MAG TPA: hypothetical protein VLL54_07505 [Pyrinomonadaceae bacterium]|nr:hypothetical protein [Pyrinomonadaceae bacterium]
MSELDEAWTIGLAEAERRARAEGRSDIADYLALRSSNDLIRKVARDWLLQIFTAAAGSANRAGAAIQIARAETHRFKVGNASMVGTSLSLSSGVRAVLVEVGWPRTPRDGFIRGGGLACGNIKHVGIKKAGEELRLVVDVSGTPCWIVSARHTAHVAPHDLQESHIKKHLALLLDDTRSPNTHS